MLEVMMATAVLAVILTGAMTMIHGAVLLGDEIEQVEDDSLMRSRLVEIIRQNLRNLDPNSNLMLTLIEQSGGYSPELAFVGDSSAFTLGGVSTGHGASLISRKTPGGFWALDLLILDEDDVTLLTRTDARVREGYTMTLLDELAYLRWRFWDPNINDWVESWGEIGRRPSHVELSIAFPGDPKEQRHVIWVPPVSRLPAERFITNSPSSEPPGTGAPGEQPGGQNPGGGRER